MNNLIKLLALNWFEPLDDPYGEPNNVEVIDASNIDDPLRNGAETFSDGVGGISNPEINNFTNAKDSVLASIQWGIDWFLGLLALIALIYLIIQGIQLLLNPKDDEVKKIRTRVYNTVRVIG